MKINNEIEINSFVVIECPYCCNVREIKDVDDFRLSTYGRVVIFCDMCHNSLYLEMVIPKFNVGCLSYGNENLRVDDQ